MGAEWRKYVGTPYLYVDYSGCTSQEEMLATYEQQVNEMKAAGRRSLVLSNFAGSSVSSAFMQRAQEGGAARGADLLEKSAMVGITGLKNILLDGYVKNTGLSGKVRAFEDEQEAITWLVSP
jgi:hypothetical protein